MAPPGADADADLPLPAGTVIDGRYRLLAELGSGGMGRVYEAEHMFIRRRMALKLLRTGVASDAAARMMQEATLAGQVPHPAVVRVFDCAALGDGQVYLAMELLRGESLEQALRRPGTAAQVVETVIEVARGLAAVHRVGVVHRDIKPANIFLARGEHGVHAKLLDFGIAKLLPGAAGGGDDAVQTRAGAVLGTPYYLAPEQARGGAIDGRADLYGLGVILYEAATGVLPFVGGSFMEILAQHIRTPPLDPRQAAPARAIPDGLARLTMRLLAKDPARRVTDGDALADELEGLLRSEGEALARLEIGGGERAVAGAEAGTLVMVAAGTVRLSDGAGDVRMSVGTGDVSEGAGATPRGWTRGMIGAVVIAAVIAAVIGWVMVRRVGAGSGDRTDGAAVVPGPGPAVSPAVASEPAAVTVPAGVPEPAVVSPVGPALETPAQVPGTPPAQPVAGPGKPGKKTPSDGGRRRDVRPPRTGGEAPKTDPREPQLKPDVYDE